MFVPKRQEMTEGWTLILNCILLRDAVRNSANMASNDYTKVNAEFRRVRKAAAGS
jgi:hypothetical protein